MQLALMLIVWRSALDIVYPPEYLAQPVHAKLREQVALFVNAWEQYEDIWSLLNNLDIPKDQKATVLESKNSVFVVTWKKAFGSTPTLYLHLLVDHLPSQLRQFAIDLWFLQTEGLEHCNKIRKQFAQLMTNGHKPGHQRLCEVDSYVNRFGKTVAAHTKSTGPCLSYQLMQHTLVWQHIQRLLVEAQPTTSDSMEKRRHFKELKKEQFKLDTERLASEFLDGMEKKLDT